MRPDHDDCHIGGMGYDNMWQCSCGAWNPDSANNCGRCGK